MIMEYLSILTDIFAFKVFRWGSFSKARISVKKKKAVRNSVKSMIAFVIDFVSGLGA